MMYYNLYEYTNFIITTAIITITMLILHKHYINYKVTSHYSMVRRSDVSTMTRLFWTGSTLPLSASATQYLPATG